MYTDSIPHRYMDIKLNSNSVTSAPIKHNLLKFQTYFQVFRSKFIWLLMSTTLTNFPIFMAIADLISTSISSSKYL